METQNNILAITYKLKLLGWWWISLFTWLTQIYKTEDGDGARDGDGEGSETKGEDEEEEDGEGEDEDKADDASEKSSSDGTEKFEIVNWDCQIAGSPGRYLGRSQMGWQICNFHFWTGL